MSNRIPFRRTRFAALALLSTGTLFSTCTGRVKDAVVEGSTNFLFALLDPGAIAALLAEGDGSDGS